MSRIFLTLAVFLTLALGACEEHAPKAAPDLATMPRLTLTEANIVYWTQLPDGIGIQLTDQGAAQLQQLTQDNLNKQIAVFVGDMPSAAPMVQEPITDGRLMISAEANDPYKLEKQLNRLLP